MRLILEILRYICTKMGCIIDVFSGPQYYPARCTVYPKKYAHGFVVLCFVVVMQSFIMNSHEVFIHIHQGCFAGIGAIVRLPQYQWSKPDGYGKIRQCITTTKHSKAKTVCIFLGIYCRRMPAVGQVRCSFIFISFTYVYICLIQTMTTHNVLKPVRHFIGHFITSALPVMTAFVFMACHS